MLMRIKKQKKKKKKVHNYSVRRRRGGDKVGCEIEKTQDGEVRELTWI